MSLAGRFVLVAGLTTLLCTNSVRGVGALAVHQRSAQQTALTLTLSPLDQFSGTAVEQRDRHLWWGTMTRYLVNGKVVPRTYGWTGERWRLAGVLRQNLWGGCCDTLSAIRVTEPGAGDFLLQRDSGVSGAQDFTVLSDVGGRWHRVPFGQGGELGREPRGYALVANGRIRETVEACDCADNIDSTVWFRYRQHVFVPTAPPGGGAPCTRSALDKAKPVSGRLSATSNGVGPIWRHFGVGRHACIDGWSLAESRTAATLDLFEQSGHSWLRAAVAPERELASRAAPLAATAGMLTMMAARIGVQLGDSKRSRPADNVYRAVTHADAGEASSRSPEPGISAARGQNATACVTKSVEPWDLAPVKVSIIPGAVYEDVTGFTKGNHSCSHDHRQRWFLTAVDAAPSAGHQAVTLDVHRWQDKRWIKRGLIRLAFRNPDRLLGMYMERVHLTHSSLPDFLAWSWGRPGWLLMVARVRGRWETVPFETKKGPRRVVEGTSVRRNAIIAYDGEHTRVWYRFNHGAFRPLRRLSDPTCDSMAMGRLAKPVLRGGTAACAYGWAVVARPKPGRAVIAEFQYRKGRWAFDAEGTLHSLRSPVVADSKPQWLLRLLLLRLHALSAGSP